MSYKLSRFATGTKLAQYQDFVFHNFNDDPDTAQRVIQSLKKNRWVKMATPRCPSNLVIRHWILLDLYTHTPDHANRIHAMMRLLTWDNTREPIWAEGYSYWVYTRTFLRRWIDAFPKNRECCAVRNLCNGIDNGFVVTAYNRSGIWYPLPLGDVRDEPLDSALQRQCADVHADTTPVPDTLRYNRITIVRTGENVRYTIEGRAVGVNTHGPFTTSEVRIHDGIPENFTFYSGYNNKYSNAFGEWRDVLRKQRRKSMRRLRKEWK